jgi:glycosyltransferase involved in cell wall biosynthesis
MKILILSQWYPPEPDHVVSGLAESLRDFGHDVAVLTGYPNYPSGKIYPGYRLRVRHQETIRGVPVYRVPLYPDHGESGVKRCINYLSFAASAACIGPWQVPRPDVIHAYHPPLTIGCPAWVLSQRFRVPFTYEIQDMWPETLSSTGMLSNRPILGMIGSAAKWVYRRAAAIRVISPGFRENLLNKGVAAEKIHVIPNWADTELFHPDAPDPELARSLGLTDRFNVMYAGNVGPAQNLETLLAAAALLKDLCRVQFVIVGDGTDLPRLRELARQRSLEDVRFLGRLPEDAMSKLYASADALLVHLRDDPLFRITIPHKILSYMACGKPVVGAVAGDAADVIRTAKAGLTCPPDNPQALAEAVRQLYTMSLADREIMGENGRRFVCTSFRREHLVEQVAHMLESVVLARKKERLRQ